MTLLPQDSRLVSVMLNGKSLRVAVGTNELLADTLRRLGMFSVRSTCGVGVCGTCTVLLDGKVVSSCLVLSMMLSNNDIVTAEGLDGVDDGPDPVQEAFERHRAYQCSFCIPAMTLTVHAAIRSRPDVTVAEVKEYLSGNLCRCGSYPQIVEAIEHAIGKCVACSPARLGDE